jgi:transcriptional regulator GlxA family with amidase domain
MDDRVRKAVDFMTTNLKDPLPLSMIARKVNLSVSHLSHLFRQETGHAPGSYLMTLRMQSAAELLSNPDFSVKKVMDKVVFKDKSDFVRSFRKAHGAAASAYREIRTKRVRERKDHKID